MYCKNCGNEIDPNAAICVKCGVQKGVGTSFCPNCGEATASNAAVCIKCGYSLSTSVATATSEESKSKTTAALLAFLLGGFGAHNFYLGYTGKAIAQLLLTILVCGVGYIWSIVEGIMILTGSIKEDAKGIPLKG